MLGFPKKKAKKVVSPKSSKPSVTEKLTSSLNVVVSVNVNVGIKVAIFLFFYNYLIH